MQKKLWVILLTVLVFLSGVALGVSTVYRVESVTLETLLVSEEAKGSAAELQARLEEAYKKESVFFAKEEKAREIAKDYPYFRISGFEKSYPNRLIIEVTEDAEVYAIEVVAGSKYYILGSDGTMLGERSTYVNELNGEENVVLKGLNVTAENGTLPVGDEYFSVVLELCKTLSQELDGIRRNIVCVEVYARTPETIFRIVTREGVKLYIGNPSSLTKEKAVKAVNEYLGLANEQKTKGRIVVSDNNGEIFASYSEKDAFAN